MNPRGALVDRLTQRWVRATGRYVDLRDDDWLRGPVGSATLTGDRWIDDEVQRIGGNRVEGGGLLRQVDDLLASDESGQVRPAVANFYEKTTDWGMDVDVRWSPIAWPFGWIISRLFARRLRQLSLPLFSDDTAEGMESQVSNVIDDEGNQLGAAWLRTLRSNRQTVYSGWYGPILLPGGIRSLRVVFPLPNGSLMVFLTATVGNEGALVLRSPLGEFGEAGAYLIVNDDGGWGA